MKLPKPIVYLMIGGLLLFFVGNVNQGDARGVSIDFENLLRVVLRVAVVVAVIFVFFKLLQWRRRWRRQRRQREMTEGKIGKGYIPSMDGGLDWYPPHSQNNGNGAPIIIMAPSAQAAPQPQQIIPIVNLLHQDDFERVDFENA